MNSDMKTSMMDVPPLLGFVTMIIMAITIFLLLGFGLYKKGYEAGVRDVRYYELDERGDPTNVPKKYQAVIVTLANGDLVHTELESETDCCRYYVETDRVVY